MSDPMHPKRPADRPEPSGKWAPWWVYLIVLLGSNYLRNHFVPGSSLPLLAVVAIAVGQAAILFVLITVIWRAARRGTH